MFDGVKIGIEILSAPQSVIKLASRRGNVVIFGLHRRLRSNNLDSHEAMMLGKGQREDSNHRSPPVVNFWLFCAVLNLSLFRNGKRLLLGILHLGLSRDIIEVWKAPWYWMPLTLPLLALDILQIYIYGVVGLAF